MNPKLSKRLDTVPASPIRALVPLASAAKARGITVYHLNIGDPDIQTPKEMLSVLTKWEKNPIGYGQSQGDRPLLEAFAGYYHTLGYGFIGTEHIQVTIGGSEAIAMALFAVCDPGDEVLVFEPFYANYASYAAVYGINCIPVTTSIANGFHLPSRTEIVRHITNKTKAILVCTPNNPTGTVYTKEEMEMLGTIVSEHNLFLISDEVYREFVYDGGKPTSILSLMERMPKHCILVDSLSKRYSACGIRIGCLVTLHPEVLSGVLRIAQGRLSAGLVDQAIAASMGDVPASYTEDVRSEYSKRRDVLYTGLRAIPGVTATLPEGAFYIIAKLPVSDAVDFCRFLLTDFSDQNETVMLAPAQGFYRTPGKGKNEVRIAYVLHTDAIRRSIELLTIALEQYKKKRNDVS